MTCVGLFIHPEISYKKHHDAKDFPMIQKRSVTFVKGGILGDSYLGKSCEVTAIETEVIEMYSKLIEHPILPGQVRSNIETHGIPLSQLFRENEGPLYIKIGSTAILKIYALRTPCWKMNDICGIDLNNLMKGRSIMVDEKEIVGSGYLDQGVKMKVMVGGDVCEGDSITIIDQS